MNLPAPDPGPTGPAPAEIELKFQLDASRLEAVAAELETLAASTPAGGAARAPVQTLRAAYFDTAGGALAQARLAWRLRLEGRTWVQALKGPGDGMLRRLEHEAVRRELAPDAGHPKPDAGLHAHTAVGQRLAALLALHGEPGVVFATDIRRRTALARSGNTSVELALDQGRLEAPGRDGLRAEPVCELEFELLEGPLGGLLDLAADWVQRHALVLDVTTKAERGQALAAGTSLDPVPATHARQGPAGALRAALAAAAALVNGRGDGRHAAALTRALAAWPQASAARAAGALLTRALGPALTDAAPGMDRSSLSALVRALRSPPANLAWLQALRALHAADAGPARGARRG